VTRARLRSEDGYTLVELLICMVILGIILAPLATSFTSALRSQATIERREAAAENARIALQRMEADVHCAGNNTSVDQNDAGGFTLTLSENNHDSPGQAGWCPGVVPYDAAVNPQPDGVQWCTAPVNGSTTRFALYRYFIFSGGDATACGGTNATFQVDYVAAPPGGWPTNTNTTTSPTSWVGNIWPSGTRCEDASAALGALPTVNVDVNVALDPVDKANERYELRETMALRNADRCS
jgi:prepilin-type N-terminal cleavage/methylation domain-containing protein